MAEEFKPDFSVLRNAQAAYEAQRAAGVEAEVPVQPKTLMEGGAATAQLKAAVKHARTPVKQPLSKPVNDPAPSSDTFKALVDATRVDYFNDKRFMADTGKWYLYYPYTLYILDMATRQAVATFELPVSPQEMMVQMPFGIAQTLTIDGVVEEHNAAPTRMISLSGTTGVLPNRQSSMPSASNILGGIVNLSTISAAREVGNAASDLASAWNGTSGTKLSSVDDKEVTASGFHYFLRLRYFLENYAASKKSSAAKDWRLVLAVNKEKAHYLVTPINFSVRRSAGSPLEYTYDLQLRAFARLHLADLVTGGVDFSATVKGSIDKFSQALQVLAKARDVLNSVKKLVRAVRADIAKIAEGIRQAILFVKDVIGVMVTIIDLPGQIIQDFKTIVGSAVDQLNAAIKELGEAAQDFQNLVNGTGSSNIGQPPADSMFRAANWPQAFDSIWYTPDDYTAFFDKFPLGDLVIPDPVQTKIDREIETVRSYTPRHYQDLYASTYATMATLANEFGAGDTTFDSVYGTTASTTTRTPTREELLLLGALNDALQGFAILAQNATVPLLNTLDYVAGLSNASGIAFRVPTAKYAVPFPYGTTLEQLAKQYLGDADRWNEIAVLNGLREPYVDEVGFQLPLLTNGKLFNVNVATSENLRIGQTIYVQGFSVAPTKRHILGIKKFGEGNYQLTLDGDADLDRYLTADAAYIRAFLPDTVNSLQVIYIPSDSVGITPDNAVPGVDAFDPLLQTSGIDLLLTMENDLVITQRGDLMFAYGMANIVQKIRLALATPQGSLFRHPTFGFPVQVGASIADLSANEILSKLKAMFITDPVFEGVGGVNVEVGNTYSKISVNVDVYGLQKPLDVAVQVMR